MRKLLLLIGAFIMVFNSYSQTQDTICFYFKGKEVYEFDYQMDTILSWEDQTTKFYEIEVPQNQVLLLDLSDTLRSFRNVNLIYSDEEISDTLDSKDQIYFVDGPVKVMVGAQQLLNKDTVCTYFTDDLVIEFDYQTSVILYEDVQDVEFWDIELIEGQVLELDLSDQKKRYRKVIITWPDGEIDSQVFESKDNVQYSPKGPLKISVGLPKLIKPR
jgi:hypothetical protein